MHTQAWTLHKNVLWVKTPYNLYFGKIGGGAGGGGMGVDEQTSQVCKTFIKTIAKFYPGSCQKNNIKHYIKMQLGVIVFQTKNKYSLINL